MNYCIFFINGSGFERTIPYNFLFINEIKKEIKKQIIKKKTNIILKNATHSNLNELLNEFKLLQIECFKLYGKLNVKFIIIGICSGGYVACRIKKLLNIHYCICIAPILNPIFRKNYLINNKKQLINYISMNSIDKHIYNTPLLKKIYNTFDKTYFFIISKNDLQAPFEMYKDYNLENVYIFEKEIHKDLTTTPTKCILDLLSKIIKDIINL